MCQRAGREQHQQFGLALRAGLGKHRLELAAHSMDSDAQFIGRLLHAPEGCQPRLGWGEPIQGS